MSASHVPDDAKTRPSPFGEGLTRRRIAGQEWHVRPELAAELLGPRGLRLEEWLAAGVAAVVKHGPHRTVYHLSLPSGTYYLKHYRLAGPRAWLQNNLRPCRAYREAAASARVRAAGIETADLAAAGRRVTGPFSRDSYVLSREVPGVVPLDECLGEQGASSPRATAERRALRRNLIERLAALTASLHRRGLFHADYHAGNVLVRADGDAVRLWLIDLHPLRPARMTAKRRWAMLGMLAASLSPHATRSDRRRFLKAYAAAFGVADDARAVEAFCAAEVRRRQERADRKWRRGNRRVLILDTETVACRGLAEVGRETLTRWRDAVARGESAGLPSSVVARRLPADSDARAAWETGHALLRRGFPVPRPLLFVAKRTGGVLVSDDEAGNVGLVERRRYADSDAGDLSDAGRLLRKLHDAGFDAAPEAFAVAPDGRIRVDRPEQVAPRRMTGRRRRESLDRLLAALPGGDRDAVLRGYGAAENRSRPHAPPEPVLLRPKPLVSRSRAAAAVLLAVAAAFAGCRTIEPPPAAPVLPAKHSVRASNLVLVSDFKLPKDDPLVGDLIDLREQVVSTLDLPEPRQDVFVYLFSNEEAYRKYLDSVHPGLPPRRAYFVGTKKELAVYTYWGDRIQEDLRHEYTHGILHASLAAVPLWLDEGLAEYFEVPGTTPGGMNGDYPHQLAVAVANGWRPDIDRLERIEEFSQMRRIDYQESWAWVHYLLHASPDTRQTLLAYVADLRDASHPPSLAGRVAAVEPGYSARFLGYVAGLNTTGGAVIRAASAEL